MTDPKAWDVYWRGAQEKAACTDNAHAHAALEAEWRDFFERELTRRPGLRIADVACGAGAVAMNVDKAVANGASPQPALYCIDYSEAAVSAARDKVDYAVPVVADCAAMPFRDQGFDIVASQFGLEYAGVKAVRAAMRLVAGGGVFFIFAHWKKGAIYAECSRNAEATRNALATGTLTRAREAFRCAWASRTDVAARENFPAAQNNLASAVQSLEALIREFGPDVAGGLLGQLYEGLGQMFRRINAFALEDALAWCDQFEREAKSYTTRMEAMQSAALDEDAANDIKRDLAKEGFEIDGTRGDLCSDSGEIIALRICARRPA